MDVLIIERDELVRSVLAETLDAERISATGASDEEALIQRQNSLLGNSTAKSSCRLNRKSHTLLSR